MAGTGCGDAPPRRRDAKRTRERLIEVAGRHFARHGYDGTSVRAVAVDAGVAPNLITRYFGGKAGLFAAASELRIDLSTALPGPFDTLGLRIAAAVVQRWEHAQEGDPLLMMLRSAGTSPEAARALTDFLAEQATGPLSQHLACALECSRDAAEERAAAVQALILGVVTSRYVVLRGPLAEASADAVGRWLGDQLQRLLGGSPPPSLSARAD